MQVAFSSTKHALVAVLILGTILVTAACPADQEAGKALIKAKGCPFCHGLTGNTGVEGDAPVPKLAGQPRDYLIKSMRDFRSGRRQDETMTLLMTPRTDEEIELIADYFAAQKRY